MVQVPGCGCSSGGDAVAGGGACATTILREYCAASDGRPLLSRTVTTCNGTSVTELLELDGTPFVGSVRRCDDPCCPDDSTTMSAEEEYLMPLGREQITVGAVVESLTPPANTKVVLVENIPPSLGSIRWTDIGGPPVGGGISGYGHFLVPGSVFEYRGDASAFQMIRDGADDATIEVTYYECLPCK